MKPIPISAAKQIAEKYGYDQVIVIARAVGEGEHCTTYGKDKANCEVAAKIGDFLKFKVMGWVGESDSDRPEATGETLASKCPYIDWVNQKGQTLRLYYQPPKAEQWLEGNDTLTAATTPAAPSPGGERREDALEPLRDPTEAELHDPVWNAIWNAIKGYDARRPGASGYAGMTGTDVCVIYDAVLAAELQSLRERVAKDEVVCAARHSDTGANDPQDCNWPFCGCDQRADKVIEALRDCGWSDNAAKELSSLRERVAAALKLADKWDTADYAIAALARKYASAPELAEANHAGWCSALSSVLGSLRGYPNAGGDINIMREVERIVRESAPTEAALDTERLDWMQNSKPWAVQLFLGSAEKGIFISGSLNGNVREAIDAARSAEAKKPA